MVRLVQLVEVKFDQIFDDKYSIVKITSIIIYGFDSSGNHFLPRIYALAGRFLPFLISLLEWQNILIFENIFDLNHLFAFSPDLRVAVNSNPGEPEARILAWCD